MTERRIGRFRLISLLGKGGMASVWRAEDELLGRTLALKVLSDELATSATARHRFRHEAEIATRLDHPAIAPVYAHGEDDGRTWMAMRLIDGEPLTATLARALLPVDEVLRIVGIAAGALGYAHAQGVVHRDVTTNNIMLARDRSVFVMDFGLAYAQGLTHITSTGVTMGTLGFVAPEVLMGAPADARSDVYGLGVVLYQMLTGSLPFSGECEESVSYQAAHASPGAPSLRRAGLDAALDALVLKAIARVPADRFVDAPAFAEALAERREHRRSAAGGAPAVAEQVPAHRSGDNYYLAVAPVACDTPALTGLAAGIESALRARLPGPQRLHVVEATPPGALSEWPRFADTAGVNVVLSGRLREAGTQLRLELWLTDPASGVRFAGGHVDGTAAEPFALEDAAVRQALALLGLANDIAVRPTQPIRRDPAAEEHFAQALRYLRRYDHEASVDGAIGLLEKLTASEGARAEWFASLSRAYLKKYDMTRQRAWESRAVDACARARSLAPDHPGTLLAWADLMMVAGREAEAVESYERVVAADPDSLEALLGLAILHSRCDRGAAAEAAARRAIGIAPGDWRSYQALGTALIRAGQFADAVEPLQRAAGLSPDNARVRRNLAIALAQTDRLQESADLLRQVVALEPSDSSFANLGAALWALGDREGAIEALEKATRLAPANAERWGNLASALHRDPGRAGQAAEAYERAIGLMQDQLARNPVSPEGWALLADWLQMCGRGPEADQALARALAIAPDNYKCLLNAAYVMHARGDRHATLDWLRRALAHGHGTEILKRSAEFEDLQEEPEFRDMLAQAASQRGSGVVTHAAAKGEENK